MPSSRNAGSVVLYRDVSQGTIALKFQGSVETGESEADESESDETTAEDEEEESEAAAEEEAEKEGEEESEVEGMPESADELADLSYRQLQSLAKEKDVQANLSREELTQELSEKLEIKA